MPAAVKTAQALEEIIRTSARRMGVADVDAVAIAQHAVETIVSEHGGRRLYIPMYEQARRALVESIRQSFIQSPNVSRIARRHRVSRDFVARTVADLMQRNGKSGG